MARGAAMIVSEHETITIAGGKSMPRKLDDKTYGDKLIRLFAHLMFTSDKYSLNQLRQILGCSKPSIIRLVRDLQQVYGAQIEDDISGRERYISMKKTTRPQPAQCLTADEMNMLQMCKNFTQHLLGSDFEAMAQQGLLKSRQLLPDNVSPSAAPFASFEHGTVDYTPHQKSIKSIIKAINKLRVCEVTYQAVKEKSPKIFHIKPLRLFSHGNTLYLHAEKAKSPGKPYKAPKFNPVLAIHRIKSIERTDVHFEFPKNYDFNKAFGETFGIIKEDCFEVTLQLTGWAARFARERNWSADQKILEKKDGDIELTFNAASEPEVISLILSLGDKARILKPQRLVDKFKNKLQAMEQVYR